MEATVVLLTRNGGPALARVLASVLSQEAPFAYEVLAIDSGSEDGTLQLLGRLPVRVERVAPADFGFARTKNYAAGLARGSALVFLSQDAEPVGGGWLTSLIAPLVGQDIAGVYGRQVPWPGTTPMERFFLQTTYPPEPTVYLGQLPAQGVAFSNVNAAVSKAVLGQVPFPEDVFMSEDQAWAQQVLRQGYRLCYEPRAAVYHAHRYSLAGIFRRSFDSGATLGRAVGAGVRPVAARGVKYLAQELGYLVSHGSSAWIPYALLYELCRLAGYLAGNQIHRLPPGVRRRLSAHPALAGGY